MAAAGGEDASPLRIAVMVNEPRLAYWQLRMLEKIEAAGHGRVVLAMVRGDTPGRERPGPKSRLGASLFHRYTAWDRDKFRLDVDPFRSVPLAELGADIEAWTIVPETTLWSDRLNAADLETLERRDIDLIVRFGWRIVRGGVLDVPRWGIWSYHHGDNRVNRGGPPCFWETAGHEPLTGLTLQVLGDAIDAGLVLARGSTATDPVSPNLTRSRLYWLSVELLPREVAKLRRLGGERYLEEAAVRGSEPAFYSAPLLTDLDLSLRDVVGFVGGRMRAYVGQAVFERRFEEKWVLYFRLGESLSTALWQFTRIESGDDRYWADPHVIERDGRFHVFVEEYPYATRRAHIAVITIEHDGTVGEAVPVLKEPHHLSYPFMFEHDGTTYMIPESGANRSIDLYECTGFPHEWVHRRTLMRDVYAVDATLHRRDGLWWLFVNLSENEGHHSHDELHLFSTDDLLEGEWLRHPRSAIVSDPSRARPAGPLIEREGKLYRPAQDCSNGYGYAVRLMEITELTPERYSEREATAILPDWAPGLGGVHTLCHVPGITVVDAKTWRPRGSIDYRG